MYTSEQSLSVIKVKNGSSQQDWLSPHKCSATNIFKIAAKLWTDPIASSVTSPCKRSVWENKIWVPMHVTFVLNFKHKIIGHVRHRCKEWGEGLPPFERENVKFWIHFLSAPRLQCGNQITKLFCGFQKLFHLGWLDMGNAGGGSSGAAPGSRVKGAANWA